MSENNIKIEDEDTSKNVVSFLPTTTTAYPKSNILVGAKFRSSLLENKLLSYSLSKQSEFDFGHSERETIKSVMSVSELRKALGGNKGSFYSQLSSAAAAMTGKTIGITSQDSRTFDYIAIITRATCKDGIFTIEYNGAMRDILVKLKKNYSMMNLPVQLSFKNNYAFRLYELLCAKCYYPKWSVKGEENTFCIRFELSELKLELGVVNAELESVKKILRQSTHPDYDKAVEASPEKMFQDWYDFRRGVLEKALKEINKISDIRVSYTTIRQGKGGKVTHIDFTVVKLAEDDKAEEKPEKLTDEQERVIADLQLFMSEFTHDDIAAVCEDAKWDKARVLKAFRLLLKQKNVPENPVGWLRSAIKGNYNDSTVPVKKKKTARKKTQTFKDFEQRTYDTENLENQLLSN